MALAQVQVVRPLLYRVDDHSGVMMPRLSSAEGGCSSLAAVSWGAYGPAEYIIAILFFGLSKRICVQFGGAEKINLYVA